MDLELFKTYQAAGQLSVTNLLLDYYAQFGLTSDNLVLLLHIKRCIDQGHLFPSAEELSQWMGQSEDQVYQNLHELIQKGVLSISQEALDHERSQDVYQLDGLWEKLWLLVSQDQRYYQEEQRLEQSKSIVQVFEEEFSRPLSPFELETIGKWLNEDQYSEELLSLALKEAVLNQAYNFKYIDRVLRNWEKKNIKTAQDVKREQASFEEKRAKQDEDKSSQINKAVPIFNWLDNKSSDQDK